MPRPFGELIHHYRLQRDLSLRDLQELVGMSATNLSRIERGVVGPPAPHVIRALAQALDVPEMHLLQVAGVDIELPVQGSAQPVDIEEAIANSGQLTELEKGFLLSALRMIWSWRRRSEDDLDDETSKINDADTDEPALRSKESIRVRSEEPT